MCYCQELYLLRERLKELLAVSTWQQGYLRLDPRLARQLSSPLDEFDGSADFDSIDTGELPSADTVGFSCFLYWCI